MSKRTSGLLWILLGLLLAVSPVGAARAQEGGVLEGRVVNGTAGGAEIGAGVPVSLSAFQGEDEVDSWETVTDADGHFRFDGLDTDPTLEYWPGVDYLDVSYTTETAYRFDSEQTALDAVVTVFEKTDDDTNLQLDSVHLIAESFGQVLRISEIHLFGNTGDRTYVGSDGLTVSIPLPDGAVGVAFEEGVPEERFVDAAGGYRDTEPVLPGSETSMAFFSYHLMVTGDTVPVERAFAYPVRDLSILVAQPGLAMQSEQVISQGTQLFQGQQFEFFTASNLSPDEPLLLEFQPMESESGEAAMPGSSSAGEQGATPASTRGNQPLLRILGYLLAGLALVGAIAYVAAAKRPVAAPSSLRSLSSNPKARRLLSELAELEDAYGAGQVDEATYERQRAEKYEALRSL